ncbi:TetR/AcrR family transcriptional regulator [Nocardioides sp. NBC_00368]|uniref:TetR/AcrR family transcriptional regulator n=1 Tax=Nocardioides sp. NBC_00368 TaxID=2976000 RepID=UPI002E1C45EA
MKDMLSRAASALAESGGPSPRAPEIERILDAGLELFVEHGIKRTTIGDIARVAGIDRVTVYRRVGGKDAVIHAVVTREATALFELVANEARSGRTIDERVELAFTSMMEQIRGHSLLARMLKTEPETVLTQLTTEGTLLVTGATLATMRFFQEAVDDGLLDSAEGMEPSAELLVRVVHSYLLTPQALIDLTTPQQLRAFARTHIVPMVLMGTRTPQRP